MTSRSTYRKNLLTRSVRHLARSLRSVVTRSIALRNLSASCSIFVLLAFLTSAGAALADWREDMGRLRIGLVAGSSVAKAILDAEPFRLAVEEKLEIPVELVPMSSLAKLAGAQIESRVEYAIYPATTYAAVWFNCECVEPLAVARAIDNTAATYQIAIGRTADGRLRPADLAGKRIWLLTGQEAMGQQLAIHGLRSAAIAIGEGDTNFLTADHPGQAIENFVKGEGDALIGWSSMQGELSTGYSRGTLKKLAALSGGTATGYYVIWKSQSVPHRTHAVRKNLDGEAKKLLRELLETMFENDPVAYDSIEPVYGGGFQVSPHSAFAGAIDFVRSLATDEADDVPAPEDENQSNISGGEGSSGAGDGDDKNG